MSDGSSGGAGPRVVWGLVIALAILHYDFWYWDDRTLVLGFLPVGLAFHALFSLACGLTWAAATRFAWLPIYRDRGRAVVQLSSGEA